MASYTAAVDALTDVTAGETLDAAGGGLGHAEVENRQNQAARDLAAYLDTTDVLATANVGYTIVEITAGVWSGDAPAGRSNGANPIWFIPLDPDNPTNPSDPTDGIDTPANIRAWDRVGPVTVDTL